MHSLFKLFKQQNTYDDHQLFLFTLIQWYDIKSDKKSVCVKPPGMSTIPWPISRFEFKWHFLLCTENELKKGVWVVCAGKWNLQNANKIYILIGIFKCVFTFSTEFQVVNTAQFDNWLACLKCKKREVREKKCLIRKIRSTPNYTLHL